MLGSKKCLEMSLSLEMFLSNFSFDEVQSIGRDLLQCSTQTLQSINAPLQQRSSMNGGNASEQKKIFEENRLVLSRLISIFNRYLSVNQSIELNGDFVKLSLKKLSSSKNRSMDFVLLQANLIESLSMFDDLCSLTNLSRSRSLILLDEDLQEIQSTVEEEFFIDRDPTFDLPPMIEFHVTSRSENKHFFDLTHLNVNLTYSIHLQMSIDDSDDHCYSIGHQFNPRSTIQESKTFCSNQTSTNFTVMIESFLRSKFSSIVFVIRQLNDEETLSTYFLRVFVSGCFSLDENQRWKSNQLKVKTLSEELRDKSFISFRSDL